MAGPNRRERERQASQQLLALFQERWPQVFPRDFRQVKPLAIGIHRDISAQLPEQLLFRISRTIALYQRRSGVAYLCAVLRGGPRYDLSGTPRGEVTAEEQAQAKRDLTALYERRKASSRQPSHRQRTMPMQHCLR